MMNHKNLRKISLVMACAFMLILIVPAHASGLGGMPGAAPGTGGMGGISGDGGLPDAGELMGDMLPGEGTAPRTSEDNTGNESTEDGGEDLLNPDSATGDTADDDGTNWIGIIVALIIAASLVAVVVALLPKKRG